MGLKDYSVQERLNKINDSLDSFFKTGKHYE